VVSTGSTTALRARGQSFEAKSLPVSTAGGFDRLNHRSPRQRAEL
jgi:hypothetical protein